MLAYVKDVVANDEVIKRTENVEYKQQRKNTYIHMNAMPLIEEYVENVLPVEQMLYNYAKNQGIDLLISEPKYSTALVNFPEYKAICIEKDLIGFDEAEERMVSLSHEIGHYLDVKFNHAGDAYRFNMVYNDDTSNCITMELVAWIYGRNILKALGYENDNFFIKQMLTCLGTYVGNKEKTVKIAKNWAQIVGDYEEECQKVLSMIVH